LLEPAKAVRPELDDEIRIANRSRDALEVRGQ
jgi:hypothetical protein